MLATPGPPSGLPSVKTWTKKGGLQSAKVNIFFKKKYYFKMNVHVANSPQTGLLSVSATTLFSLRPQYLLSTARLASQMLAEPWISMWSRLRQPVSVLASRALPAPSKAAREKPVLSVMSVHTWEVKKCFLNAKKKHRIKLFLAIKEGQGVKQFTTWPVQ